MIGKESFHPHNSIRQIRPHPHREAAGFLSFRGMITAGDYASVLSFDLAGEALDNTGVF